MDNNYKIYASTDYVENELEDTLLKSEQTLTDDELNQVRKNLRFIG